MWVFLILEGILGVGFGIGVLEAYELSSYLDNGGLAQEDCSMN